MEQYLPLFIAFLAAGLLSSFFLKELLSYLATNDILDAPNTRSNHTKATPRGAGLAIIGAFLCIAVVFGLYGVTNQYGIVVLGTSTFILAAISWADDIAPLSIRARLLTQIAVIVFSTLYFNFADASDQFMPTWLGVILFATFWLWFMNAYNFMDGIDGITLVETLSISVGVILCFLLKEETPLIVFVLVVLCGAMLPFFLWNWHPAKMFLGDVGSIPLGYILGVCLFLMAFDGLWAAAIILPGYYFADSGITLLKRAVNREKIWQAHSKHFYQIAVRNGVPHNVIVRYIALCNLALIALACLTVLYPESSENLIFVAICTSCGFLYFLKHARAKHNG
jgi:UDP-N-acetylmuramyl pentapeptide phosphotransferase/UDP-N-acetylglucosamine-1-phosphate transferase